MLDRSDIENGFARLGALAAADGIVVDLAVYGGSAIALAWGFRVATRDVDAVVRGDPAMKCMALRAAGVEGAQDVRDIEELMRIWRLDTAEAVLSLVERFYPERIIPPKVRFGVEEIVARLHAPSHHDKD
jgi:hypothetical protein